jgi:hypothetical protein
MLYPIFGATQAIAVGAPDFRAVLDKGLVIQDLLAHDKYKETGEQSKRYADELEAQIKKLSGLDVTVNAAILDILRDLSKAATKVATTADPSVSDKVIRKEFEPFGEALVSLAQHLKITDELQLYYCPMVKHYWVRPLPDAKKTKKENMANPYMGTKMLDCGVAKKWPRP